MSADLAKAWASRTLRRSAARRDVEQRFDQAEAIRAQATTIVAPELMANRRGCIVRRLCSALVILELSAAQPNRSWDRIPAIKSRNFVNHSRFFLPNSARYSMVNVPDAKAFIEKIEATEHQVAEYSGFLKKLKMRLSRTKKALASKPAVASQVAALVNDLNAMRVEPGRPAVPQLIDSLEGQIRTLHRRFQDDFPSDLRSGCESASLDFKPLGDGFGVGPFLVAIDAQKQVCSFQYAKTAVQKDVPLNVSAIVAQATVLKAGLVDPPVDQARFRSELYEAMRVAVARREARQPMTELRVELPVVFREMGFIRVGASGAARRKTAGAEYSLSRFVIELKQFMQSDQNLHSDQPFQLEPAVIENTKNPKKSLFIPQDVACGFGEGSYYQAIVLRQK